MMRCRYGHNAMGSTRVYKKENRMVGASSFRQIALLQYLKGSADVEGWLHVTTGAAMAETLWIQERLGITGNVAEIGIHHGRSFIALALGMRANEIAFAIDLFEKQHLNIDYSGMGDRAKFLRNLSRFSPATKAEIIC